MGDKYRKQMKRGGYSKLLYNQRNKNETILSVIKRLFGEHITSRLVKTQNRELLSFKCIAYNIHRLTHLIIIFYGFPRATGGGGSVVTWSFGVLWCVGVVGGGSVGV
jgi:hypothetical protein